MTTPNDQIAKFLDSLPDTIRESIYTQIALFLVPDQLMKQGVDVVA